MTPLIWKGLFSERYSNNKQLNPLILAGFLILRAMKTINKILTKVNTKLGAPMGRNDIIPPDLLIITYPKKYVIGREELKPVYDCKIELTQGYDKGGAYWGIGKELRVSYTKDLTYIIFYRTE